jgi:uncharacterized ferritin-like protein (DUF455 family)
MKNLFESACYCLLADKVDEKLQRVKELQSDWQTGALSQDSNIQLPDIVEAGHPEKPELVSPREVPKRRLGSPEGQAAMIHAIGHIEFNAINLACDAVFRYRDLPPEFYGDWIRVAAEEVYHFSLIRERLRQLGYDYGDFPAHTGLWDLARQTTADLLQRMALVPRMMEARGLDVTPGIIKRFRQIEDQDTVEILEIILHDEIGHVQAGSRWFNYVCQQRGVEPEATYFKLLTDYTGGKMRCPLHIQARLEAGFSESELHRLEALCGR